MSVPTYRLYGRSLASGIPMPELMRAPDPTDDPDFVFVNGIVPASPTWTIYSTRDDGSVWTEWNATETHQLIRFPDLATFAVSNHDRHIVGEAFPGVPEVTLRHLLIDQVVPMLIGWSGHTALHACAVTIDGEAVVLLGESGMGKSTLTASFGAEGFAALADDCVVIDESRVVQPSYPSLRLHPTSAKVLVGSEGEPVAHYNTKQRIDQGLAFSEAPVPLGGVLTIVNAPDQDPDLVEIRPLTGQRAFASLLAASFSPHLEHASQLFHAYADIANHYPIGEVTVPDNFDRLEAVREAIVRWRTSA